MTDALSKDGENVPEDGGWTEGLGYLAERATVVHSAQPDHLLTIELHKLRAERSRLEGVRQAHVRQINLMQVSLDEAVAERPRLVRYIDRLENAITHHKKAHDSGQFFADVPDEALWKARDKIMTDVHERKG